MTSDRDAANALGDISEGKYRALAETLSQVVYRADPETFEATYVNSSIDDLYGYSPDEWLSDPSLWKSTIHPEDRERVLEEMERLCQAHEEGVVEYRIRTRDGDVRWVEDHVSWEREGDEVVSMNGVLYDVTPRVRYEQELKQQRDQLAILNQLVRHDIRNDMTVVLGWSETLRSDVPEPVERDFDRIVDTTRHAIEITQTARDLVNIIQAEAQITTEPVPLRRPLLNEFQQVRRSFPHAEFELLDDVPPVDVEANQLLSAVFRNILTNAVEHSDKETPRIEVSVDADDETVTVAVADNGPGIHEDLKRNLFTRTDGLTEDASIGLYLVGRLLDQYGGDIEVTDNEPEGSVFTVELRRASRE